MVVPAGGAWLAVHVLPLLLLLAAQPLPVSMAVTSSWSGDVNDNVTADTGWEEQQADMPVDQRQPQQELQPYYGEGMETGEEGEDSMLADRSSQDQFHTGRSMFRALDWGRVCTSWDLARCTLHILALLLRGRTIGTVIGSSLL